LSANNERTESAFGEATMKAASTRPRRNASAASGPSSGSCIVASVTPFSRSSNCATARVPLPSAPMPTFLPLRSESRSKESAPRWNNQTGS
jgi:hypothetical protein